MLVEKAREKWDKKHDLNCAECIMYAANEEYNLNLSKETLKVILEEVFSRGKTVQRIICPH